MVSTSIWRPTATPRVPVAETPRRITLPISMVVKVGGSMAYLPGDGILTFDDSVRTVGQLKSAIEQTTAIPTVKQV